MKYDTEKYKSYKVISFGKVSSPDIGESRFLPSIMLSKDIANEVTDIIDFQVTSPPGDIESVWTKPLSLFKTKDLILKLKFTNPQNLIFGIILNIDKHSNLIDGILISQAIYLETGNLGDKIMLTDSNKMIVEIPKTSFQGKWDKIQLKSTKRILKKKGVKNKELDKVAREYIKTNREIWFWRGK